MTYSNNGPVYSNILSKEECTGQVEYVWTYDEGGSYWSYNSGSCSAVPFCMSPPPSYSGTEDGETSIRNCRLSGACDNCPPGHINWGPWSRTGDGPDGDWCTRYGFATNCDTYGDCRNVGSYIFGSADCGAGSPCGC